MRGTLVIGALRLLAWLPLRWNRALATGVGWLMYVLPNPVRRVSAANIELCLPEWSAEARRSLLKSSLIETSKTALEAGPLWIWPAQRTQALMTEVVNGELIDDALRAGQGVILATPHLGSWEIAGQTCARRWPGMTILYRPPRLQAVETLIRRGRQRTGAQLVTTDASGVKQLYHHLNQGGVIGILPDQDPGRGGGCFAPFFGIQANSMVLLGRLARKTGARVIFGYSRRLPGAAGYILSFTPAPAGIDSKDPAQATAAMNQAVETMVRGCPEQYQWSYKRFRTRPEGEPRLY